MSDIKNGGPAFPIPLNPGARYQGHAEYDGMTLRDYFAAKAMSGLLSNSGGVIQSNSMSGTGYANGDSEGVASWAYELADAMLKERNK